MQIMNLRLGWSTQVLGQLGLHSKALSQKQNKQKGLPSMTFINHISNHHGKTECSGACSSGCSRACGSGTDTVAVPSSLTGSETTQ